MILQGLKYFLISLTYVLGVLEGNQRFVGFYSELDKIYIYNILYLKQMPFLFPTER